MSNSNKVQQIFISDGTALPANNADTTSLTAGKVGIYGQDMLALNPAGGDTITTQPYIYIMESKTDSNGVGYIKRTGRIDGANIISYTAKKYAAEKREVWSIGHSRLTGVGTIEVNNDTDYKFAIRFKNDKQLYSERPEVLSVLFTSAAVATQLSIATQITSAINNSAYRGQIKAVTVGDGTGVYGLTGATDYGVEIWGLDINANSATTYTHNQVYFSVSVLDASGFGTGTTCTQIQAFDPGNGTYKQVYAIENFELGTEGVLNRRQWPIPVLDYSASSTMVNSTAIGIVTTGTTGEDTLTYATTIAAILKPGDKIVISGVTYEIKYIMGDGTGVGAANAVVLTSVLLSSPAANLTILKVKYDLINIEYNDAINTPTGVVAVANKSVVIAVPAIDNGGAYNSKSAAEQDLIDILDAWMATTPRAFAAITSLI
jgi:hypothetical protein